MLLHKERDWADFGQHFPLCNTIQPLINNTEEIMYKGQTCLPPPPSPVIYPSAALDKLFIRAFCCPMNSWKLTSADGTFDETVCKRWWR